MAIINIDICIHLHKIKCIHHHIEPVLSQICEKITALCHKELIAQIYLTVMDGGLYYLRDVCVFRVFTTTRVLTRHALKRCLKLH